MICAIVVFIAAMTKNKSLSRFLISFLFCQNIVDDALKTVERVLEINRNPRLAEDVDHAYDDKYGMANLMTNTALIAQVNVLKEFGLTMDALKAIDKTKPVTLRFQAADSCSFLKEQIVEVPADRSVETDEHTSTSGSSFFGNTTKSTIKQVVNHIQEYHWKVDMKWEISIYSGSDVQNKTILQSRSSSMVLIVQSTKRAPLAEHRECKPLDVSLTWLMSQIDTEALTAKFRIDTEDPQTKTPRRNKAVEEVTSFMRSIMGWTNGVRAYFQRCVQIDIIDKHNPAGPVPLEKRSLLSLSGSDIFVPVQPLMEEVSTEGGTSSRTESLPKSALSLPQSGSSGDGSSPPSPLLSNNDMHKLLNEQIRSIQEQIEVLQKTYPARHLNRLVSAAEATLVVLTDHVEKLSTTFSECVDYIESMLENQLVAAIGKRIQSSDIDQFVKYHYARLLDPPTKPFCHSIRRPDHYPDGLVSIESMNQDGKFEPIETLSREVVTADPILMPLNDATTVELSGKKFLHGWIQHRFGPQYKSYNLTARARQFSSFMLVVGTMTGPTRMDPKDAIILQNKDELLIPLLLEEIPTAKEFKDAIRSLSPEQQRFAQAFRNMQLNSSLLGICVIQIKPQLEELLGLPADGLTKEMKLTHDLMSLFVDYQVPSDMLSCDAIDNGASNKEKIDIVKGHVKAVLDVVDQLKANQLEEQKKLADMAYEMASAANPHPNRYGRGGGSTPPKPAPAPHAFAEMAFDDGMIAMSAMSAPMAPPGASAAMEMKKTRRLKGQEMMRASAVPPPQAAPEALQSQDASVSKTTTTESSGNVPSIEAGLADFTMMPKVLDSMIEKYSPDSALRSTVIKTSNTWTRKRQENLLSLMQTSPLFENEVKSEKDKAFDLLDALSRSGSLPIKCSELHVIVSTTHCFEKDVMNTIIEDNINPIEKLEMTALLVASVVHGASPWSLIRDDSERMRLKSTFPMLLANEGE